MMWYVYYRHLSSGREDFVGVYDTEKEAVHKIAQCYYADAHSCQKDEYYYFMIQSNNYTKKLFICPSAERSNYVQTVKPCL